MAKAVGRPSASARAGGPADDVLRAAMPVQGAGPLGGDVGEDLEEAGAVAACGEGREGAGEGRVVAVEEGAVCGVMRVEPAAAVEEPVAGSPGIQSFQIG